MLRNAILGAILLSALPFAGASAQYVELAGAARHQMLVQMQAVPEAAEAARPWIGDDQRVQALTTRRRPRFSYHPPRG